MCKPARKMAKVKPINRILTRSPKWAPGLLAVALAGGCVTEPPVPATIAISPELATLLRVDATVQLTATVRDRTGRAMSDVDVDWTSGDESVGTVDDTGLVTAVGKGMASVRAVAEGVAEAVSAVTVDLHRGALLDIYAELDGSNWYNSLNWGTRQPIELWWGVSTDGEGNVVTLSLSNNHVAGSIPAAMSVLETLKSLDLASNHLTGPIAPELGNLKALHSLFLDSNELTGRIPPELGDLGTLSSLSLDRNALTGPIPPELGDLVKLSSLSLGHNELAGPIPPELGNLAALGSLKLGGNDLTGPIPPELGNLRALESLNLERNGLTGPIPPELGNLRRLARLALFENRLTGPVPPELGDLTALVYLGLARNPLTGPVPPELGKLRSLAYLHVDNTMLSGRLPHELTALRLSRFFWHETDLCSPPDEEFQEWLESIRFLWGYGKCMS